jgi:hypothetical protein
MEQKAIPDAIKRMKEQEKREAQKKAHDLGKVIGKLYKNKKPIEQGKGVR